MFSKKLRGETPSTATPTPITAAPVGALANCVVGDQLFCTETKTIWDITYVIAGNEYPIKLSDGITKRSCTYKGVEFLAGGRVVFVIPVKNEATPSDEPTKQALADVKVGDYLWDNLANEICEVELVMPSEAWPITTYSLRSCDFGGYEATGDSAPRFTIPTPEQLATLNTDAPQPNDEPQAKYSPFSSPHVTPLPNFQGGEVLWDTHNDTPVMVIGVLFKGVGMFDAGFPFHLSNGDYCTQNGYHYDFGNLQLPGEGPRYRMPITDEELEQCAAFSKYQQPQTKKADNKDDYRSLQDFLNSLLMGNKTVSVHPVMAAPKSGTPQQALPGAQVVNINTQYHEKVSMNITFNIEVHV